MNKLLQQSPIIPRETEKGIGHREKAGEHLTDEYLLTSERDCSPSSFFTSVSFPLSL